MGFLGLGAEKAMIEVFLDRDALAIGEALHVAVRVTGGSKDLTIDEGRLRLVYENEYEWRETSTSYSSSSTGQSGTSSSTTTTHTDTDRQIVREVRFLGAGVVSARAKWEQTISIVIPERAVPTGEGKITRVRWHVEATLVRPRARDVAHERPIAVLSRLETSGWTGAPDEVDSQGKCELSFEMEGPVYGPGEEIRGALVVTPSADSHVSELRVDLEREEEVPRGLGNEARVQASSMIVAGGTELESGRTYEYPFLLDVPVDVVPTLRTAQSTIRWKLRGIGARRMRSDYRVARELLVCSAPASADRDMPLP